MLAQRQGELDELHGRLKASMVRDWSLLWSSVTSIPLSAVSLYCSRSSQRTTEDSRGSGSLRNFLLLAFRIEERLKTRVLYDVSPLQDKVAAPKKLLNPT